MSGSKGESGWRLSLAPWKIRRKLILLHTVFSLGLATILLVVIRPAVREVAFGGEIEQCRTALAALERFGGETVGERLGGVSLSAGNAAEIGLGEAAAGALRRSGEDRIDFVDGAVRLTRWDADRRVFVAATVVSPRAGRAVIRLYVLVGAALLIAYGLIAMTLEVLVLPQQVYGPINRLLRADDAVQRGDQQRELIPEDQMPADELGEIMRSRNESIEKLRAHERDLAAALERLEAIATDLKRKNHLLATVRQNMADQDRLVSLGMMSAGVAHELNTPLAVLKGSVEEIVSDPSRAVDPARARLMLRVVNRLERLSESLLDFARARPSVRERVDLPEVVREAWTLVRIDRDAKGVRFVDRTAPGAAVLGDADRLTQVFVNLLRNAVDAMEGDGAVTVRTERSQREGREWVTVSCSDSGPGIEAEALPTLFEPFTSTRLDAEGTGLGLAVAEGIVGEHGGVILAHNDPAGGAVFEVMLPVEGADAPADEPADRQEPAT